MASILISTPNYYPESNGVANVVGEHVRQLVKYGHEVIIATKMVHGAEENEYPAGVKIHRFNIKGVVGESKLLTGDIAEYRSFLSSCKVDVIIFHCWQIWNTDLAFSEFENISAKKVLFSHGVSVNTLADRPKAFLRWLVWRRYAYFTIPRIIKKLDHIVFLSDYADDDRFYDKKIANELKNNNISVIPNGAAEIDENNNIKYQDEIKKILNVEKQNIAICVSQYYSLKNQSLVLNAFIDSCLDDWVLIFVGQKKNAYSRKLENKAQSIYGKDYHSRIRFTEGFRGHRLQAIYQLADLFIFGSKTECLPLVILDAMANKLPYISTNVGCIGSLPGGVVVNSRAQMTHEIVRLAHDSKLRATLGEIGFAGYKERYNWTMIGWKLNELINNLLKRKDYNN